jgi:hypothetical protein
MRIRTNSVWRHHTGRMYRVVAVANQHSNDPDKYPIMITYVDINGRYWAKDVTRFLNSMTEAGDTTDV